MRLLIGAAWLIERVEDEHNVYVVRLQMITLAVTLGHEKYLIVSVGGTTNAATCFRSRCGAGPSPTLRLSVGLEM